MAVSFVNTQQPRIDAWIQPGCRADIAVVSTESWPVDTVVTIGVADAAGVIAVPLLTITPDLATLTATVALTGVQVAALAVACPPPYGVIDWQWRTGAGSPLGVGSLHWDLTGARTTQTVTVMMGPAGPGATPEAISALVEDYLVAHPPTGSGDVTGPASAIAGNLAALDATGKILSDSGSKPADFAPASHNHAGVYDPAGTAAGLVGGITPASIGAQPAGSYAPALGPDDNYLTDTEKAQLHTHPAVIAQGATQADARAAIGAGTSSLTLGVAAGTAAAGNDARLSDQRTPSDLSVTNAKVAAAAAISLDKTADSATRLAMTSDERAKLADVATAATANATDAQLRDRATHTGTQTAATISDFTEGVQDVLGAMVAAAGGTYDDTAGTITLPTPATRGLIITDANVATIPAGTAADNLAAYYNSGAAPITVAGTELAAGSHAVWAWVAGAWVLLTGASSEPVPTAPTVPTSVQAVADADSITLTWAAPASGGSVITGYKVYRGVSTGALTLLSTLGDVLTYDDTTASSGTTYHYTVAAVNAVGTGAQSSEVSTAIAASGPTLILADDFNRANNGTINAVGSNPGSTSTGDIPWTSSAIHTWGIVGNGMVSIDSSGIALVQSGESDVAVEAVIATVRNYDALTVRYASAGNYYRIGWAPNLFVYKYIADATTVILSEGSPVASFSAGDVFRVEAVGSSWTVKKNGAAVHTFTDSTHSTATQHGLRSASSDIALPRWDDFKVYAL